MDHLNPSQPSTGDGGETSQSEWSEDDDGAASEPLLDQESTGYTTDDPALEQVSMINDAGLTDAEGENQGYVKGEMEDY